MIGCQKNLDVDLPLDSLSKDTTATQRDGDNNLYSKEYILEYLEANEPIDWEVERDPKLLYSISMYTDSILMFIYKPDKVLNIEDEISSADISDNDWLNVKNRIHNEIEELDSHFENLTVDYETPVPFSVIKSQKFKVFEKLCSDNSVHSLEVSSDLFMMLVKFPKEEINRLGCSCDEPSEPSTLDYSMLTPDVKVPWNYEENGITTSTWQLSTGSGIGVAVIDSGVSFAQENLDENQFFNSGESIGRSEQRINFLPARIIPFSVIGIGGIITTDWREIFVEDTPPSDDCGHGTRMAGIIAAPRGSDGNSVGIAYNCDLYNFRAVHNPIILTTLEKAAVAAALFQASSTFNIKVISMSIAQPFGASEAITIGLANAYSSGKMIVSAAGSSFADILGQQSIVLFPANDWRTVAVTGIRNTSSNGPLTEDAVQCTICHYGHNVQFAVILQDEEDDDRTSLTVTCDYDIPTNTTASSCAIATVSGIAALIWSKEGGSASREVILNKMREASSNPIGDDPNFGYGWINTAEALQ